MTDWNETTIMLIGCQSVPDSILTCVNIRI